MDSSVSLPVSVFALGGLGEVGKNMYCIENKDTLIIIDAGVRFPGIEFPGIDYIVPDFTYLKNNRNKVKALFITHGHEDHIGGIPFLLQSIHIPVIYAPRLASALIKSKLEDLRMQDCCNIIEYDGNTKVKVDSFNVSFFRVTHSIPDSFGVVVDTSEGRIVSTGDFKIDLTPVGPDIDLTRIAEIGSEGVDLLLSDSTNAEKEGYTPSEKNVFEAINEIFDDAPGRLIISTFSSNVSRIEQICNAALSHDRKIVIIGRSMEKVFMLARSFGYIKAPDSSIIQPQDIKLYRNNQILILCTGSQGEPMAALSRIASGDHKDIHIIPGDTVVFSSSAIPGNGIMIEHVVNTLSRCGADVVTNSILSDIHSSGHPAKQELRLALKLFKPKYFMPMHGDYRMLFIHAQLAETVGVAKGNSFILDNGDSIILARHKVKRGYQVEHGNTYIDGRSIAGLAETVIEDRRDLTENGMLTISIALDPKTNKLLVPPTLFGRGLINKDNTRLLDEINLAITEAIRELLNKKTSFAELKLTIKKVASDIFFNRTNRKPMIIPLIMTKN